MCSHDRVCDGAHPSDLGARPVIVKVDISAASPTQVLQTALEGSNLRLSACIVKFKSTQQHCDAPHPLALLRTRHDRPRCCRAAKRSYEFTPADVNCHATLPRGSCSCNGGTIPRFARAVCGYLRCEGPPRLAEISQDSEYAPASGHEQPQRMRPRWVRC